MTAALVWATGSTPFGLLKMERGDAEVDGKQVSTAQLLLPGQKLVLEAGEKALIRFFGSASEVHLEGPYNFALDPVKLLKEAQKLKRNSLKVSDSIGSRVATAGLVQRVVYPPLDEGPLRPQLPPRETEKDSQVYELVFGGGELYLDENAEVRVEVYELDASQQQLVFRQDYLGQVTNPTIRTSRFRTGQDYRLAVTVSAMAGRRTYTYNLDFRYLTSEERDALAALHEQLERKFRKTGDVNYLAALAQAYGELKQAKEALAILTRLKEMESLEESSPEFYRDVEAKTDELKCATEMPLVEALRLP